MHIKLITDTSGTSQMCSQMGVCQYSVCTLHMHITIAKITGVMVSIRAGIVISFSISMRDLIISLFTGNAWICVPVSVITFLVDAISVCTLMRQTCEGEIRL